MAEDRMNEQPQVQPAEGFKPLAEWGEIEALSSEEIEAWKRSPVARLESRVIATVASLEHQLADERARIDCSTRGGWLSEDLECAEEDGPACWKHLLAEQKQITDSIIAVDVAGLRKAWKGAKARDKLRGEALERGIIGGHISDCPAGWRNERGRVKCSELCVETRAAINAPLEKGEKG